MKWLGQFGMVLGTTWFLLTVFSDATWPGHRFIAPTFSLMYCVYILVVLRKIPNFEKSERGQAVAFLRCESFEHRFTPETQEALAQAADDIAKGLHTKPGHGR